jgi:probable phosphoglycerate mutase
VRLVLIRHADSIAAQQRLIGGPKGCTGLTELGFEQARTLAGRLRRTGELSDCQALLTSPWLRARQTAEVLASALPVDGIEEEPDLCELRPGEADGLHWDDFVDRYGDFDMQAEPDRPMSPQGETWNRFVERVGAALDRLTDRFQGRTAVAVTHGGFISASILIKFGIVRPGTGAWLEPENTALTEWSRSEAVWKLVRYNDAAHLQAVPD